MPKSLLRKRGDSHVIFLDTGPTTPKYHWGGWDADGQSFTACGRVVARHHIWAFPKRHADKFARLCHDCAAVGAWPKQHR